MLDGGGSPRELANTDCAVHVDNVITMVEINHNQHPTAVGCEWVYRRMQWAEWTNRQAAQTGVVEAKQGAWADGSQTRGAR